MKLAITADHAGFNLKKQIIEYLKKKKNLLIKDLGTDSNESVDYPDFGHKIAAEIENGKADFGISICGSGNGINMTANKHQGIRSALCWNEEISRLARAHNDANICALPGRFINIEQAIVIIERFLNTGFDGERHERRKRKIPLRNNLM
ncbi:MAG: ribose 5-phosphate isomerase B [Chlorobi bacterium]|nr:ribose 5-phosphate isomerase B [Chlorobiota bacterium]